MGIFKSLFPENGCATMTLNQPKGDLSVMEKGTDLSVFHDASVVLRTTEGHGLAHFTEAAVKKLLEHAVKKY